MRNLPIGIQSFSDLRTNSNDYLYVDKTQHIYNMINGGKIFFLSRPRRFGKSLLVSAMNELFNGSKSLFEGLYIYDKWDWSKKNPVIRIDFSMRTNDTKQQLENSLSYFLDSTAANNGLKLEAIELADKFGELITKLHTSTNE
ncbi:MAG: AAA family ATPase, partial [Endomicrobium sp.]|nr:AAA family ATPase [Endomicrobium sp.]